jgi:hypothetical protein
VRLPLLLKKPAAVAAAVSVAGSAAEDGSRPEQQQQQQQQEGDAASVGQTTSSSTLYPAVQQQQQRSAGLDLLSRVWQQNSAVTPLLPAPPDLEGDVEEPQRAAGGDWGVTDAALSLRTLLGSSRWAAGLQQPQQQQPDGVTAGVQLAAAEGVQPQQQQQPKQKQKGPQQLTAQQQQLLSVLSTVVAFDAVSLKGNRGLTWSAQQGLRVLEEAASRLYMELAVGSFSCGLQVRLCNAHYAPVAAGRLFVLSVVLVCIVCGA